ncbi:hypothetical protein MASR2M39_29930 [Ignavibacteriales bacterium]
MDQVRAAKIELSNSESFIITSNIGSTSFKVELTREIFENRSMDLLNKIELPFQSIENNLIENGEINSLNLIDHIVLVGGSSRMPMIQNMVIEKYGGEKVKMGEFDFAIAKGAALSISQKYKFQDVTPKSLGVLINGENGKNLVHLMIEKDQKLPISIEKTFIANPGAAITVMQGNNGKEGEDYSDGQFMKIEKFNLDIKNKTEITVSYSFNANGIISIEYWGKMCQKTEWSLNSYNNDSNDSEFRLKKQKLQKLFDSLQL